MPALRVQFPQVKLGSISDVPPIDRYSPGAAATMIRLYLSNAVQWHTGCVVVLVTDLVDADYRLVPWYADFRVIRAVPEQSKWPRRVVFLFAFTFDYTGSEYAVLFSLSKV